jgi:hypothetical protein
MVEVARKMNTSRNTIYRWVRQDKKLKILVKEAREIQASSFIEEMIDIADDDSGDIILDEDTGRKYPNAANVARAKLKITTRRKLAGFYHPTGFGDKSKIDLTSSDGSVGFVGLQITPPKDIKEEVDTEEETQSNDINN